MGTPASRRLRGGWGIVRRCHAASRGTPLRYPVALHTLIVGGLILSASCNSDDPFQRCAGLEDERARQDCRFEAAAALAHDEAALDAALDDIEDDGLHDLLVLRLVARAPAQAEGLCLRVRTPVAKEKCDHVMGRPHLVTPAKGPR